jgi:hypothetical protein
MSVDQFHEKLANGGYANIGCARKAITKTGWWPSAKQKQLARLLEVFAHNQTKQTRVVSFRQYELMMHLLRRKRRRKLAETLEWLVRAGIITTITGDNSVNLFFSKGCASRQCVMVMQQIELAGKQLERPLDREPGILPSTDTLSTPNDATTVLTQVTQVIATLSAVVALLVKQGTQNKASA